MFHNYFIREHNTTIVDKNNDNISVRYGKLYNWLCSL